MPPKKNSSIGETKQQQSSNSSPNNHPKERPYKKVGSPKGKAARYAPPDTNNNIDTSNKAKHKVYTVKLKSGDILMFVEKQTNAYITAPYLIPSIQYMRNHQQFTAEVLGIARIFDRVNTENRNMLKITTTQTNRTRTYPVFVTILTPEQEQENTDEYRLAWAETFIEFHNHKTNQAQYNWFTEAEWGADLTPQNDRQCPYLSEYLTDKDTMTVIRHSVIPTEEQENGTMQDATIEDVLNMPGLMEDYYHPSHMEQAKTLFNQQIQQFNTHTVEARNNGQIQHPEPDDFSDLVGFKKRHH